MRYEFGGLIFGGAYTCRGLYSEFYGISVRITAKAHLTVLISPCNTLPPIVCYFNTHFTFAGGSFAILSSM